MNPELNRAVELAASGQGEEARAIVIKLADKGDPHALYTLGDMYWRGALVECDWNQGFKAFQAAEEAGNEAARIVVTNLMASGVGCERNWPAALARLEAEAPTDPSRASAFGLIGQMALDTEGNPADPPESEPLLESPGLWAFPQLFSAAECDYLRALAEPILAPSLVTGPNLEQVPDPIRTSDCATIFDWMEDPAVHALNRRLALISGSVYACGEPLLILRYRPMQHYMDHLDALPGLKNQRVKTALVYLNDDYEGGHTAFPAAGISYRGRLGDAILFANVLKNGQADQASVHAGLPVLSGEKYLASRWIRKEPMFNQSGWLTD